MPTTPDTFLFGPGECDEPIPTPPLVRRHRYIAVVPVEATTDGVPLAPPATLATMAMQARSKRALAAAKTPTDLFGGIPINLVGKRLDKAWNEPLLPEGKVATVADLVRRGSVDVGKKAVRVDVSPEDEERLAATGHAVVPRHGGGWMRIRLSQQGAQKAVRKKSSNLVAGSGTNAPPPPPPPDSGGGSGGRPASASLGLLLPFEQVWTLKSYERGELISSIALTPLEETTIEIFSWDRRKSSVEDTTSSESERVAEGQSIDRDTRDVFGEITRNSAFNWGLNGSLSAGVPGKFGVQVGGNVGSNTTLNDISRATRQDLQETTVKSTERVKSSRQTKVTESVEEGSETRTTRKLRNANQSYALTYNYFALLARYGVSSSCIKKDIKLVLQLDLPAGTLTVDYDFVRTHEPALRRRMLDTSFAAGFEAARTLWMYERACAELCIHCDCDPPVASTASPKYAAASLAAQALAACVMAIDTDDATADWSGYFDLLIPIVDSNGTHGSVPLLNVPAMRHAMFVAAVEHLQPGLWGRLVAACRPIAGTSTSPTAGQVGALISVVGTLDPASLDGAVTLDQPTQDAVTTMIGRRVKSAYNNVARPSLVSYFASGGTGNSMMDDLYRQLLANTTGELSAANMLVTIILYQMLTDFGLNSTSDSGLRSLIQPVKDTARAWLDEAAADDQASRTAAATARRERETAIRTLFGPEKMLAARERFDALKNHLLANNDYYAFQLLTELIGQGRYQPPLAVLQYMPFVDPRPIAVVDGKLCFALEPAGSATLGPILAILQKDADGIVNQSDEEDVQLPTPGMVVEPKLSMCGAAEPDAVEARRIELEQRQALATQALHEAKRRGKLLESATPNLDPFEPPSPAIHVVLEKPQP